jgi:hypothetical protein
MTESKLTLRFFDALNGEHIKEGSVIIDGLGQYETDYEGKITFPIPELNGVYAVIFEHKDYIFSEFDIEIQAGTIFFNRFSISPKMKLGKFRIVLDWGEEPSDLDAHLVKRDGYHISFRNMKSAPDGEAQLDRDDLTGFGPETITINNVDNDSKFTFYVHDFSNSSKPNSSQLAESKAVVKIYGNDRLLHYLEVPKNLKGDTWNVFSIIDGRIHYISGI